jgi:hypothetical protein
MAVVMIPCRWIDRFSRASHRSASASILRIASAWSARIMAKRASILFQIHATPPPVVPAAVASMATAWPMSDRVVISPHPRSGH